MGNENPDATWNVSLPVSYEPEVTIADMLTVFNHGRIGEIEFRNWLAEVYPSFARARREDVDKWLEDEGERIAAEREEEELLEEELESES